jgi:hypothetical protein
MDRSTPIASRRSRTSIGDIGTPLRNASRTASVSPIGTVGVRPISFDSVPIVWASCARRLSISRRCSPSDSYSLMAEERAVR